MAWNPQPNSRVSNGSPRNVGRGGDFWHGGVLGDRTQPRLQMRFNTIQTFIQAGIPFDTSVSMFTNTIEEHGDLLGKISSALASEFGARHVHIVAHSKGGLDSVDRPY